MDTLRISHPSLHHSRDFGGLVAFAGVRLHRQRFGTAIASGTGRAAIAFAAARILASEGIGGILAGFRRNIVGLAPDEVIMVNVHALRSLAYYENPEITGTPTAEAKKGVGRARSSQPLFFLDGASWDVVAHHVGKDTQALAGDGLQALVAQLRQAPNREWEKGVELDRARQREYQHSLENRNGVQRILDKLLPPLPAHGEPILAHTLSSDFSGIVTALRDRSTAVELQARAEQPVRAEEPLSLIRFLGAASKDR
ncbi:MAG: hypothetical protein AAF658_17080, partial [Myxococcota bacterium]